VNCKLPHRQLSTLTGKIINFNPNYQSMENYDTVVAALKGLKDRGYTRDFNIAFDQLTCSSTGTCLRPADFEITEVYRFEGATDPADEDIVYAIESKDGNIKGTLTSAYGMYADEVSNEMVQKLAMHRSS